MNISKFTRPVLAAVLAAGIGAGVASAYDACNPCIQPAPVVAYNPCDPCDPCGPGRRVIRERRRGWRWFGWFRRSEPAYYHNDGYYYR